MTLILYWSLPALLFFSFGIFAIPNVWAITIEVDADVVVCTDDLAAPFCTIQAAIDDATAGDTINVAAGTYSITSDLTIDKKLILQGAGSGDDDTLNTIIDLDNNRLEITSGGTSTNDRNTIQNIRIIDGKKQALTINADGFYLFDDIAMLDNRATGIFTKPTAQTSDIIIRNSFFENNGLAELGNPGDIKLFLFEGTALIENVDINKGSVGTAGDGKNSYGIEIRGLDCPTPAASSATVTLNDVTITGNPNKEGLLIQCYSDVTGFSLTDVDLSNVETVIGSFWPTSLLVVHSGTAPLNVGNLKTQEIWNNDGGPINAKQAKFFDSSVSQITNNFQIEDVVTHGLDSDSLGLVTWVSNNVYVTPNSGSIQRGIDVVQDGDTINVKAGTYDEFISINKPLTLNGPNAGINPVTNAADRVAEAKLTGTYLRSISIHQNSDVNPLKIDGFLFENTINTQSVIHATEGVGTEDKDNVSIINNRFINSNEHAIFVGLGVNTKPSGWKINNNLIDGVQNFERSGIYTIGLKNCEINGNKISNISFIGILTVTLTNCQINNNIIDTTQKQGILLALSPNSNTVISGNTITNANPDQQSNIGAIVVWADSNDITIENNNLNSNHNGFVINADEEIGNTLSSDVIVRNNKIFSNTGSGAKNLATSGTLDAENNYWGHPKGPFHSSNNPDGQGDSVSDNIDFGPWYLNSARTNLSSDQSGSQLTPQGNTQRFDSDDANSNIRGQASFSTGFTELELGDDGVIDFTDNVESVVGNNIFIGGVEKDLTAFTIKDKDGLDVVFDLKTNKPSVGDKIVDIQKGLKFKSGIVGEPMIFTNTALPGVSYSIPDGTTILAPDGWNEELPPPRDGSSLGTAPSGFSVGGTVIEVGSPDVVLLFDTPVELLLSGVTGNVGYKPAGSSTWVQITNTCGNTFDSPDPPTFPGECFISGAGDTKIVTFHFTTFGGLDAIVPKSGSGAGGDKTKPVLQSNSLSSPGSVIFGGTLSLDPNQPLKTPSLFETNDVIDLELSFFENTGAAAMQHVALYTNIRNFDTRYDSDLSIEWNKDQPIKVYDPNGFLKDDTNVTTEINNSNLDMTFHVTFAKPMETSNIVLYFWDYSRHGVIVTFEDALKIIQPGSDLTDVAESGGLDQTMEEGFAETKESSSLDKIRQELNGAKPIPVWIKTSAGWWSEKKINDADFVSGIQFLIQNNIIEVPETEPLSKPSLHVPDWLGNTAGWWSDGLIPDEEFIQSIQWLIANGVIVI